MDDTHLIGHMGLLLGAAHLTSAHTLTWTMFLVAQHPNVRHQIANELEEKLSTSGNGKREITVDDIESFPFLERVVKESMRIMPASAYSQRFTTETVQLGPFKLPPHSPIIFSQFMTQHRADIFEDPESFRPERWETITPGPYEYLPFGGGPRRCIGAPLAMMQFMSSLPRIFSRYQFQMQANSQVEARVISTMLNPMEPVMMHVGPDRGEYVAQPVTGSIHDLVDLPTAQTQQRRAA